MTPRRIAADHLEELAAAGLARIGKRIKPMDRGHDTPCWITDFHLNASGYATLKIDKRPRGAHRVTYLTLVGPIPDGLVLDHLCRVRECVNPTHLEPVTPVNCYRGESPYAKKRRQTACVNGHEFTPQNTHVRKNGTRACRECHRIREAMRRAKLQAVSR